MSNQVVFTGDSPSEMKPDCPHETLQFAGGAYYVVCQECQQFWVAKKSTGLDSEPDHSLGAQNPIGLRFTSQQVFRLDWKDRPKQCKFCGDGFTSERVTAQYCSNKCKDDYNNAKRLGLLR